jgi:hypothetical protein
MRIKGMAFKDGRDFGSNVFGAPFCVLHNVIPPFTLLASEGNVDTRILGSVA